MARIGEIKLNTSEGTVTLPVFEPSDIGSGVYDFLRVMTESGVGVVPFSDPGDAAYNYLRLYTGQGVVAANNEARLQQSEFIDNFSDGDLSEYTAPEGESMSNFSVTSSQVFNGAYSLEVDYIYDANTPRGSVSTSGLSNYPSKGDVFSFWYRANASYGEKPQFRFNWINSDNYYFLGINQSNGGPNYEKVRLYRIKNGSGSKIASSGGNGSADLSGQEWHKFEIHWNYDDTFDFYVYDSQGNLEASGSGNDNDPLTKSKGIGFNASGDSAYGANTDKIWFDYIRIESKIIDNWEDGDTEGWSSGTSNYGTTTDSIIGDYGFEINDSSDGPVAYSLASDGLNYYPRYGDTCECYIKNLAGDGSLNEAGWVWFGVGQSDGYRSGTNGYAVQVSTKNSFKLVKMNADGTSETLDSASPDIDSRIWRIEFDWQDTKKIYLYDYSNKKLHSELSAQDTEYDGNKGIALHRNAASTGAVFDNYRKLK